MTAASQGAPAVAVRIGTATRLRFVFEGRERGLRALDDLLRLSPRRTLEIELVALAVPRVPGAVRVHLGGDVATEQVVAAARRALDEMSALLARRGMTSRTRVEAGTFPRALQAALRNDGVDLSVVATGWPRWCIAWLLRGRDRAVASPDRMLVA